MHSRLFGVLLCLLAPSLLWADCPDYFDAAANGEALEPARFRNGRLTHEVRDRLAEDNIPQLIPAAITHETRLAEAESVADALIESLFHSLSEQDLKVLRMMLAEDLSEIEIQNLEGGPFRSAVDATYEVFPSFFLNIVLRSPEELRLPLSRALKREDANTSSEALAKILKGVVQEDVAYQHFVREAQKLFKQTENWRDLEDYGRLDLSAIQVSSVLRSKPPTAFYEHYAFIQESVAEIAFSIIQNPQTAELELLLAPRIEPAKGELPKDALLFSVVSEGILSGTDDVIYHGSVYVNTDGELSAVSLHGSSMLRREKLWYEALRPSFDERVLDGILVEAMAQRDAALLEFLFVEMFEWELAPEPVAGGYFFPRLEDFNTALEARGLNIESLRAIVSQANEQE